MQTIYSKLLITLLFIAFCNTINAQKEYKQLSEAAMSALENDSLDKAESLFKEAMRLEPANKLNALLFTNLGWIQKQKGELQQAIDSYGYALNIVPNTESILLDRAALYVEMGMTDQARYDYTRVLDNNPNSKEALLMRAYLYTQRREYNLARSDYKHLFALDPNNYNGRLGFITMVQKEGKFREALEVINAMIVDYPDDATLYVVRADIEQDMKHTDLALIDLDKAIELAPNDANAYLNRGEIYLQTEKKALAKADFERAASLGVPMAQLRDLLKRCQK